MMYAGQGYGFLAFTVYGSQAARKYGISPIWNYFFIVKDTSSIEGFGLIENRRVCDILDSLQELQFLCVLPVTLHKMCFPVIL